LGSSDHLVLAFWIAGTVSMYHHNASFCFFLLPPSLSPSLPSFFPSFLPPYLLPSLPSFVCSFLPFFNWGQVSLCM
jgi:hypothetical protein